MEYSGPATLEMMEEDLRMSDEELDGPQIPPNSRNQLLPTDVSGSATTTATLTKKLWEEVSSSEESLAPAPKNIRVGVQRKGN